MRKITIPGTGLTVSNLCLGGGSLGTRTAGEDAYRLIDHYLDLGGNFIDSAHIYAAWAPGAWGASERTIGEWLSRSGARDRVVLCTKGGHPNLNTMDVSRLSAREIEQDLDESLERLAVDTIDLYLMHRDDPNQSVMDIVDTLQQAVARGKIRHFGLSNWSVPRIREAMDYCRKLGVTGVVANQAGWSLAELSPDAPRDPTTYFMDRPTYQFHREAGLFAMAYSPHAGGFFAKDITLEDIEQAKNSHDYNQRAYYTIENFGRLARARELAAKHGVSPNAIALAYLLHHPFPSCAIIGCGTTEHLRDSMMAADVPLTPDEIQWLAA